LNMLNAEAAWSVTRGAGVTVAVIDSGVNPDISDLSGSVIAGPDYTGVTTRPSSKNWGVHGTWMASLSPGTATTTVSAGASGTSPGRIGKAPASFPADSPGVISVSAVNVSGNVAPFSSDNLSVKVAAPGVSVPAQGRDGQYWLVSGTSPACALVAGVAALIKS